MVQRIKKQQLCAKDYIKGSKNLSVFDMQFIEALNIMVHNYTWSHLLKKSWMENFIYCAV